MSFITLFALAFFALIVPSTAEQGYVVVPCAVSTGGTITLREECGFVPVSSIEGAQPVPSPYLGGGSGGD